MAYYDALISKWPDVTGATTADKLVALNAETVTGAVPSKIYAPRSELINAIVPADLVALTAIQLSQLTFAFGSDMVDVTSGSLPYVAATTFFAGKTTTLSQLGAVVSKYGASPQVPWWQANGYSGLINYGDLAMGSLESLTPWAYSVASVDGPDALGNTAIALDIWDTAAPDTKHRLSTKSQTMDAVAVDDYAQRYMRLFANRAALAATIGA